MMDSGLGSDGWSHVLEYSREELTTRLLLEFVHQVLRS
jgi:hypothetical protein